MTLIELAIEEDDPTLLDEVASEVRQLSQAVDKLRLALLVFLKVRKGPGRTADKMGALACCYAIVADGECHWETWNFASSPCAPECPLE